MLILYDNPYSLKSKKLAKMKAKFIKAKECGASINTPIAEGVTILDAMKELGINPHECGYDDQSEESNGPETDPNKSGIQQLISIIAGFCDKVMVMYAGKIIEKATTETLFSHPKHPYTQKLLDSLPRLDLLKDFLSTNQSRVQRFQQELVDPLWSDDQ